MISTKFTFNDCFLQEHLAVNGHNDLFKLLQITIDWVLYLITNCTQNHSQTFCSTLRAQYTQFHIHGWRRLLALAQTSLSDVSKLLKCPMLFPRDLSLNSFLAHHRLHSSSSTHTLAQLCTHGQCRHSISPQSCRSSKIAQRTLATPVLSSGLPWQHISSTRSTPFRWG